MYKNSSILYGSFYNKNRDLKSLGVFQGRFLALGEE